MPVQINTVDVTITGAVVRPRPQVPGTTVLTLTGEQLLEFYESAKKIVPLFMAPETVVGVPFPVSLGQLGTLSGSVAGGTTVPVADGAVGAAAS